MPERTLTPQQNLHESELAFKPSFVKDHFTKFRQQGVEEAEAINITKGILERDLTYYFMEQFAKENLVHFSYRFREDNGSKIMVSPKYEAVGDVVENLYAITVSDRLARGLPVDRETAELEGMQKIKIHFQESHTEQSFVLISQHPDTDPKHQRHGYDDYNFVFFGSYNQTTNNVDMFAWRNHIPTPDQAKIANEIGGKQIFSQEEAHPNDFLRNPIFVDEPLGYLASAYGKISKSVPQIADFEAAKRFDLSTYRPAISHFADELTSLIHQGRTEEELDLAMVSVETEFVKWVNHEKPMLTNISYDEKTVAYAVQELAAKYSLNQYARNHCGLSGLSRFSTSGESGINSSNILKIGIGMFEDHYGTLEIHCQECGTTYLREKGKLEDKCRNCFGTKGIIC